MSKERTFEHVASGWNTVFCRDKWEEGEESYKEDNLLLILKAGDMTA